MPKKQNKKTGPLYPSQIEQLRKELRASGEEVKKAREAIEPHLNPQHRTSEVAKQRILATADRFGFPLQTRGVYLDLVLSALADCIEAQTELVFPLEFDMVYPGERGSWIAPAPSEKPD